MENIGTGGGEGYNCDISLLSSHPALHTHRQDVSKNFSVSHLLELQGAGNLYHAHSALLAEHHHRVGPDLKIPEGKKYEHLKLSSCFPLSSERRFLLLLL